MVADDNTEYADRGLFSMLMRLGEMEYFARNGIRYSAAKVKKYFRDFDIDNLEYSCSQFDMPYFPLDEPWEKGEVFEDYKDGVQLTQVYLKELQSFHQKYYQDYCQYKHGLAVALTPMQNPLMKDETDRCEKRMQHPMEGGLQIFHQGTIGRYEEINQLYDEGNLLFSTMHVVGIETVTKVTEHACILLDTLWKTIIWRCEEKDEDEFHRIAFPTEKMNQVHLIGFSKEN